MKRFFRFVICTVLCITLIFTSTVFISAASIDKVENISVDSVAANKVVLTWDKVPDVSGYKIYRYFNYFDRYIYVGRTSQLRFTDRFVGPSKDFSYKVRAYKENIFMDSYGPYSDVVTTTTSPARVNELTAGYITDSAATISWAKCEGAVGYTIYLYDENTGEYVSVGTTTKTEYTLKGLKADKEYSCKVAAYHDANGTSHGFKSKAVVFRTIAKDIYVVVNVPKKFTATTDNVVINLSWSKSSNATGYEIFRYDRVRDAWKLLATTTSTSYTDSSVSGADIFKYKMRAFTELEGTKIYSNYTSEVSVHYETIVENESIYNDEFSQSGLFGYLYDPVEKCFYTASDPWQRTIGYNSLFDTFAPMSLIDFDTTRLRFDYDNKDWMIQLWKGQYGAVFYGAEIGVYTKPKDREVMHFDCASDNDQLKMSMDFYEYKERIFGKDEWVKLFSRPYDTYWWCTGFVPGNKLGDFSNLRIEARITMKDYTMLSAVKKALDDNSLPYTVNGLNVYISYH